MYNIHNSSVDAVHEDARVCREFGDAFNRLQGSPSPLLTLSGPFCLQAQTYGLATGGQCVPCHCNSFGSKSFDCDENGQCRCQPGVSGPKCDRCSRGFFNFQEGGCTRKKKNIQKQRKPQSLAVIKVTK